MNIYIAILEQDCEPHYFQESRNAGQYLLDNVNSSIYPDVSLDTNSHGDNAELWDNISGESIGYYYKVDFED